MRLRLTVVLRSGAKHRVSKDAIEGNRRGGRDETEGLPMLEANDKPGADEVSRLLAGAAKTMASARYCWLATAVGAGVPNIRPMGRIMRDADEDEWKIRFLTDGRSRKASDMRRGSEVTIILHHEPDLAYVTLTGRAELHDRASEVRERWKDAYNVYFRNETDRANAIFVEVDATRMELWIRGVTPEPFGLQTTVLERDVRGGWRVIAR
jgi:general stress protein 26